MNTKIHKADICENKHGGNAESKAAYESSDFSNLREADSWFS